nr:MAG TPA: hypothetical protein [Caudoviricetes sp.]
MLRVMNLLSLLLKLQDSNVEFYSTLLSICRV